MVEQPSTRSDQRNPDSDKKTFPKLGWLVMFLALAAPVVIFIWVLGNWNERNPVATVILTTLIGLLASANLVRWAITDNLTMVGGWTAFFLIYGLLLAFAY